MAVIKHKDQRVGIFIDTQNLYHSAKNLYHARVNFGAVVKEALAGRSLIRAVAYVITTEHSDWATNCPEYKVTAVQIVKVTQPSAWQQRHSRLDRTQKKLLNEREPLRS